MKKILAAILVILSASCVYAGDMIDSSVLNMRPVDSLNMNSNLLPSHVRANPSGSFTQSEGPVYDIPRMIRMNPDFTTYPNTNGIIWLKHVAYSASDKGGIEITRLYVILGRHGLSSKWLNWNIQIPAKGSVEVLEANVYDYPNGTRITSVTPEENTSAGIQTVKFMGLPENFILALSWREHLPEELSLEGLTWTQEELRVWESVVEIESSQSLAYRTFPDFRSPETERGNNETTYTWHRVNIDPYDTSSGLARLQRAGVSFSTRRGSEGLTGIIKDAENVNSVSIPNEAMQRYKRSGAAGLINWLREQPEMILCEGTPRKIPSNGAWTNREKILLAKSWIQNQNQKSDASLNWQLPFDPDDKTPICTAMFYAPVLEASKNFYSMNEQLAGAKIFNASEENTLASRRIPSTKSTDNRLSAIMDVKLNEQGMMSGTVRVILRGSWGALMLGNNPTSGTARGAVLSLFPGLTNFKDVRYRSIKGTPEISFKIENKPGIGGTGRGVLALIPVFEPVSMRALGGYEAPVEMKFPFVIEQSITLGFPKNAKEALISGKVNRNPDKINYSEMYQNRRHRLIAESRFELNMQSVSSGNMGLLRKCLEQWHVFSSRQIPVR